MAKDLIKAEYYDIYKPLLTEKQCEIMEMYYFSDLSLGEISEETGITRQAAFNSIKKSEERLNELEKALGLLKKRGEIKKISEKIRLAAGEKDMDTALKLLDELDTII